MDEFKLSDMVVAHVAQLLQLALLTGTDLTDAFRAIRLEVSELSPSELTLAKSYAKAGAEYIDRLAEKVEELQKEDPSE